MSFAGPAALNMAPRTPPLASGCSFATLTMTPALMSEISLRTMENGMRAPLATGSDAASMRARTFAGTRPEGHEITAQEIFLKKFFANAKEFVIVIPAHIRLGSSVGRAGD